MIVIDCQQGSPEWHQARLGIPTASQFHRLITPKTRKPSEQAHGYMLELIAERLIGEPLSSFSTGLMDRGNEVEDRAIAYYQFQRDCAVTRVGFLLHDDGLAGCSPDGLIGKDGGLEIKCPGPKKHVENLLGLDLDDVMQAQGGLWVTGRKWWDVMSYHPDMPPVIRRIERDEKLIYDLGAAALELHHALVDARATLFEEYAVDTSSVEVKPVEEPVEVVTVEPMTSEEVLAALPTGDGIPF